MKQGPLIFENVTFFYPSAGEPVFDEVSVELPLGWTGIIGPNGAGKTTLLRLACEQLAPTRGRIISPDRVIYCPQRTDEPPDELEPFLAATDRTGRGLRGRLSIGLDFQGRWQTLSHGERKRAQIAVALWRRPRLLAIDEPTNHIDLAARILLGKALWSFGGVGLLVSHDRKLLDTLCKRCLFLVPPGAVMRPGGYTKAVQQIEAEQQSARTTRAQAKRELAHLQREATNRAREAAGAYRKRSKRGLAPKDHDARSRIDLARLTGKDGQAGRVLRQMDGRLTQAQAKLESIVITKRRRLGIDMRGARAQRDFLFRLPGGALELGERRLEYPPLSMAPADRVALVGPNGAGKSTLVRHIVAALDLPKQKVVYLAQEIDRRTARRVLAAVRRLPNDRLGDVMSVVSCLGSEPQRLMETDDPSPGELRKIMLAMGIARRPYLIIMDEPTNHLDLASIECLETALDDCPCGLLLVSHDLHFLKRLTQTQWLISPDEQGHGGMRFALRIGKMVGG